MVCNRGRMKTMNIVVKIMGEEAVLGGSEPDEYSLVLFFKELEY